MSKNTDQRSSVKAQMASLDRVIAELNIKLRHFTDARRELERKLASDGNTRESEDVIAHPEGDDHV